MLYFWYSVMSKTLSVVVPVFNEAGGLADFHHSLIKVLDGIGMDWEIIYCDDGSRDDTAKKIRDFREADRRVKLLKLSRNFGKELATTAGLHAAEGDAIITLDGDGQHPVELIPEFIKHWQAGHKVVVGVRKTNHREGFTKRFGSAVFYKLFNRFSGFRLRPGATDFRLIDRSVQQDFVRMTERNRITRGLIDWLGYKQDHIDFDAKARQSGKAGYSFNKLFQLALDSIVSMSLSPLRLAAYAGAIVLPASVLLGLFMLVDAIFGDPAHLHATGSAYVMVMLLFLVGLLLVSQGIIGLYLSHIHSETQNRPLYVIDREQSAGIDEK